MALPEESGPEMRRRGYPVRRIFIALGVLVGVFVLLAGPMVGYEQVRSISPPLGAEAEPLVSRTGSPFLIAESGEPMASTNLASSMTVAAPAALRDPGFLDPADFSEDLGGVVKEINEAYGQLLVRMENYQKLKDQLSYEEAHLMLRQMGLNIQGKLYDEGSWNRRDRQKLSTPSRVWREKEIQAFLELYEKHEKWLEAATFARRWGLGWNAEVYYYRKAGPKGRVLLTFRVLQRVKRSIMTIGPAFQTPWAK
ncbi:hypothetical protein HQ520_11135 [bacterium]|nr:hypothetical protein [bacterium]